MAAAAIALVGIAILVAHRVDTESAEREAETVRNGLSAVMMRMKNNLHAFSRWDESTKQTPLANDLAWIHHHYGRRLHETSGYDQSFILDSHDAAVYASINGKLVDKNIYELISAKIEPVVQEVRDTYQLRKLNVIIDDSVHARPASEPVSRVVFRRIDQRPALIGAVTIVPANGRGLGSAEAPAIAVNVTFIDDAFVAEL
ncbi:MAG TPA: CHASE4 domain-containing protein, partial [Xanthobacteraceae bacterium]|nr:CHASE4 domain-containing protein [Xanthobacteraceae bacterium]